MASEGPNSPGTMATNSSIGTIDWDTPNNAKVDDTNYADANDTSLFVSYYLKATNFGFSIPSGATIDGIKMEFKPFYDFNDDMDDESIKIVKGGSILGDEKAKAAEVWWGNSYRVYGANDNLWGLSWEAADINNATFGIVISGENKGGSTTKHVYVNHIRITVYYTEAAGTNTQINIGDSWKAISAMQINIGDTWKPVAGAQINIGDSWKTIF